MAELDPITRGDDETIPYAAYEYAGGPAMDLTGATLWFTAKRKLSHPDEAAIIATRTGEGIELLEDTGKFIVTINGEDTQALPNRDITTLYCDVQILKNGKVRTIASDTLPVLAEVTRARS